MARMTDRGNPMATFDDFQKLDIRVGRVLEAAPLEGARKPAMRLRIDFGPEVGIKASSAQITEAYTVEALVGRLVLGVVNFPPRRIAGFQSEVLTLGVYSAGGEGPVILIAPDADARVAPGDRLG
jgi:tRNA-binding protein